MEPDAVEIRVLGCLIEKQRTTPDIYPLSLNALRQACNQASNRDPVVSYEEEEIGDALRRLTLRGWVRLSGEAGSRVRKYRHLLTETLDLGSAELSLLAVLLLRGVQTPGELKQRSDRLYGFEDLRDVHEVLDRMVARDLVVRHERQRGQKEERYEQCLGSEEGDSDPDAQDVQRQQAGGQVEHGGYEERAPVKEPIGEAPSAVDSEPAVGAAAEPPSSEAVEEPEDDSPAKGSVEARVDWLEAEVVKLRAQLAALKEALGE
jgi:uncharacterized protein